MGFGKETADLIASGSLECVDVAISEETQRNKQTKIQSSSVLSIQFYQNLIFSEIVHLTIDQKFINAFAENSKMLELLKLMKDKFLIVDLGDITLTAQTPWLKAIMELLQISTTQLFGYYQNLLEYERTWQTVTYLSLDMDTYSNHIKLPSCLLCDFPALNVLDISIRLSSPSQKLIHQVHSMLENNIQATSKQLTSLSISIIFTKEEPDIHSSQNNQNLSDQAFNEGPSQDIDNNGEKEEAQVEQDERKQNICSPADQILVRPNQDNEESNFPKIQVKTQKEQTNLDENHVDSHANRHQQCSHFYSFDHASQPDDQIVQEKQSKMSVNQNKEHGKREDTKQIEISMNKLIAATSKGNADSQNGKNNISTLKSVSLFYQYQYEDPGLLDSQLLQQIVKSTGKLTHLTLDAHITDQKQFECLVELIQANPSIHEIDLNMDCLQFGDQMDYYMKIFKLLSRLKLESIKLSAEKSLLQSQRPIVTEAAQTLIVKNSHRLRNLEIYFISIPDPQIPQNLQTNLFKTFLEMYKQETVLSFFEATSKKVFPKLTNMCFITEKPFNEDQKVKLLINLITGSKGLQNLSIDTKLNDSFKKYKKMRQNLCYFQLAIKQKHELVFRKEILREIMESLISFNPNNYLVM